MNWLLFFEILYFIILLFVIARFLYDTRNSVKALAYILFIVFVPFIGIFFYFSFRINYRKRKMYSKKIVSDETLRKQIKQNVDANTERVLNLRLTEENHDSLINFIHYTKYQEQSAYCK